MEAEESCYYFSQDVILKIFESTVLSEGIHSTIITTLNIIQNPRVREPES